MTVRQLEQDMGAGEFTRGVAFERLEPFGSAVEDWRAGIGPATTINANRARGSKPVSPSDLMPWSAKKPDPSKAQAAAAIKAIFNNAARAARRKRGKRAP
jgi:hypothetical protein